jgi:hypothetical protein
VTHGAEATLGPYGSYRDWPLKSSTFEGETVVPRAPVREAVNTEGEQIDPVTGEALAPLQHEGSPPNPTVDLDLEV